MKTRIKPLILALLIAGMAGGWFFFQHAREKILLLEPFNTTLYWERQCTRADDTGHLIMPSMATEFKTSPLLSQDGMLHLFTGSAEHLGGGEWLKNIQIKVGKNTVMEWKWAALDLDGYQFWIRIAFNNNRTIFYKASDSKPPGFYRKKRYIPYQGVRFRDQEGRLRFFPSVTLLVARPAAQWSVHTRAILKDYQQSYGQAPETLAISGITLGMMDDSCARVNEMGVEYIKFSD